LGHIGRKEVGLVVVGNEVVGRTDRGLMGSLHSVGSWPFEGVVEWTFLRLLLYSRLGNVLLLIGVGEEHGFL